MKKESDKDYRTYRSPGGGTYRIPFDQDSIKSDKYWKDMEDRKKQHRDWEDRGEPIGW